MQLNSFAATSKLLQVFFNICNLYSDEVQSKILYQCVKKNHRHLWLLVSLSFTESFSHFRCISTVSNKFLSASSKDPPHSFCSTWGIWLLMEPSVQVPLRLCRNPQFLNNCSNIFFSLVASCFHSLFLSLYLPRYWGSTFSPHLETKHLIWLHQNCLQKK